jgi:hypothetical protein
MLKPVVDAIAVMGAIVPAATSTGEKPAVVVPTSEREVRIGRAQVRRAGSSATSSSSTGAVSVTGMPGFPSLGDNWTPLSA